MNNNHKKLLRFRKMYKVNNFKIKLKFNSLKRILDLEKNKLNLRSQKQMRIVRNRK
jgi:hypothetical protein